MRFTLRRNTIPDLTRRIGVESTKTARKETIMSAYLKSILAFLSLVVTNVATQIVINHEPWPSTWGDAGRWAATIILGTWLVWQVPNKPQGTV